VGATTPASGAFTTVSASGVATFSAGTVSLPAITTTGDTNTGIFFPAADTIAFTEGGAESMRIDASGNVGVGTSSPDVGYQLDVGNKGRVRLNPSTGTNAVYLNANNTGGSFYIGRENSAGSDFATTAYSSVLYSTGAYPMSFWTNATERMRIDSSGNVGIGTSSPGSFEGTVKTVIGGGSGNPVLTLYGGNATFSGIYFADGTTGNEKYRGFFEYDHASDALRIGTTGSTRATLDSSGNLGLGVTPSAWTGYKVLQIGTGTSDGALSSAGNETSITTNAYNASGWKYQTSSQFASKYFQSNGQHIWQTAGTGTAGNAITFTQAMTLDASGNLGIGTTSPTQKLTVNGVVASIGPASSLSASSVFIDYNTTSNLGRLAAVGNTTGTAAPIYFSQYSSNASVGRDAMIIDSSGNVGIGTSSPAGNLQISGSGDRSLLVTGGTAGTVSVQLGDSGAAGQGGMSYDNSVDALFFKSNGTERMRIASNGQRSTNVVSTVGTSYDTLYPAYDCRAWVNFNGTGTVAIRASGNVSSITDNGTGDYTVNFTTAMPDANYSATCGACRSDGTPSTYLGMNNQTVPSTTAARFRNRDDDGAAVDALFACVAFFR
jgi:hypothetical protein